MYGKHKSFTSSEYKDSRTSYEWATEDHLNHSYTWDKWLVHTNWVKRYLNGYYFHHRHIMCSTSIIYTRNLSNYTDKTMDVYRGDTYGSTNMVQEIHLINPRFTFMATTESHNLITGNSVPLCSYCIASDWVRLFKF